MSAGHLGSPKRDHPACGTSRCKHLRSSCSTSRPGSLLKTCLTAADASLGPKPRLRRVEATLTRTSSDELAFCDRSILVAQPAGALPWLFARIRDSPKTCLALSRL